MKRPMVWGVGLLFLCFLIRITFFNKQVQKEQYCLNALFDREACCNAIGTIEQIEQKKNSVFIYLKDVSIQLPSQPDQGICSIGHVIMTSNTLTSSSYNHGNQIRIQGKLKKLLPAQNPGQFDERSYYREQNIFYKIEEQNSFCISNTKNSLKVSLFSFKQHVKKIYQKYLNPKDAGVVTAMLLGDRSALDSEIKELYQQNGIGHILAISGLHISILSMALYRLFQKLCLPRPIPFCLIVFFLFLYGIMTGFSVSTSRAIIMMCMFLLAKEIGRSYDTITALAFSAMIILIQKPYAVFSVGFLLSYGAVLGVVLIIPVCKGIVLGSHHEQDHYYRKRLRKEREQESSWKIKEERHFGAVSKKIPRFLCCKEAFFAHLKKKCLHMFGSLLLASISISMMTTPLLLWFFYELPTYSILINLLVLPAVSFLVILSALGGLAGILSFPFTKGIFSLIHCILAGYDTLCRVTRKLPFSLLTPGQPPLETIVFYYVILFFMIFLIRKILYEQEHFPFWKRNMFVMVCMFLMILLFSYRKKAAFSCTMLDVGQGNGILIQTAKKTILVDGGSSDVTEVGKYRLLPCLKYYGITCIDAMIMTHADTDHISGQLELIEMMQKGQLTITTYLLPQPEQSLQDSNYKKIVAEAKKAGITLQYLHKKEQLTVGDLSLYCVHPEKNFCADSANAYSTTLSLQWKKYSILLTGDLEKNGEEAVLEELQKNPSLPARYDFLQVPHHGSKNAGSEVFLQKVLPKVSLISCGYQNRYGHPHAELLERLKKIDSHIYTTPASGAINIKEEPKSLLKRKKDDSLKIETFCKYT